MSEVTIKKCDGCGITDDVRKVNDYRIQVYRNNAYVARSTVFQLCNICPEPKINLALSTVKAKLITTRKYGSGKSVESVFQREPETLIKA